MRKDFENLIEFLQQDLEVSQEAIQLVLRHHSPNTTQLPIVLHQYGLITTKQLGLVFSKLETLGQNIISIEIERSQQNS